MKLFLDIDGVMVPAKGYKLPELLPDGFPAFSSKATKALSNLIDKYNADVVLTTSHKSKYTIEEWKEIFRNRNVLLQGLESLPANVGNLTRMEEILEWFKCNAAPAAFVILDDDKALNALPAYLKEYLVLTSPYVGLTDEHVEQVEKMMLSEAV